MSGSMRSKQASSHPMPADSGAAKAGYSASPRSRDGLLHPTALPLGLAIGCCLGVLTAVIAFF